MQSTTVSEIKVGGTLTIKVVEGRLFRDTEVFGKMDPYCVIITSERTLKTKVH
jgi:Ca2+-dependent lipid-binding protein